MRRLIYKNAGERDYSGRIIEKNALYVRPYNDPVPVLWNGKQDKLVGTANHLEVEMDTGNIYIDVDFDAQFFADMGVNRLIPVQVEDFYDDFDYNFYATDIILNKMALPWLEQKIVSARLRAIYVSPLYGIPLRIAKELANGK